MPKNVNFYTLGHEEPLHNLKQATDKNGFPVGGGGEKGLGKCGGNKASSAA